MQILTWFLAITLPNITISTIKSKELWFLNKYSWKWMLNLIFGTITLSRYGSPLWSSGQEFLATDPEVRLFWGVVCLERGPLSLLSTVEELLERKNGASGQGNRECGHRDPSRWPHGTPYLQKGAWASGGRSVGIVHLRTQATESVVTRIQDNIVVQRHNNYFWNVGNCGRGSWDNTAA
jgi:hypothetical protein